MKTLEYCLKKCDWKKGADTLAFKNLNENIFEKYESFTDEEIIIKVHNNDECAMDYIITKYKNLVKIKARAYFLMGADREDIIQEGMIGLYKAIRDFNSEKEVCFNTFASICITRQILTAIKNASRQKHMPLNSYVSLNKSIYAEEEKAFIDELIPKNISNPEELLIGKEDKIYIEESLLKHLSEFEHRVLSLYLAGNSYSKIASKIEKDEKSIDNALQRVRKKLEKIIKEKNLTKKNTYAKI